jgi:hypothetical protein
LQWLALTENTPATGSITFESYGLRVRVETDSPQTLAGIPPLLPPGWRQTSGEAVDTTFTLFPGPGNTFELKQDGRLILDGWPLDVNLVVFQRELRLFVALEAPGLVFVHAGVVAHRGHAIVIPGKTYSGKTSMVAALVRAGAEYYSDEYAPLDENGLVHPFPKPLSLRRMGGQVDHAVESLGGVAGTDPIPVGLVVATTYEPNAEWAPVRLTSGEGVLALLEDTLPARTRPNEWMRALTIAAQGAVILQGTRGEADDLAPVLLATLGDALSERI